MTAMPTCCRTGLAGRAGRARVAQAVGHPIPQGCLCSVLAYHAVALCPTAAIQGRNPRNGDATAVRFPTNFNCLAAPTRSQHACRRNIGQIGKKQYVGNREPIVGERREALCWHADLYPVVARNRGAARLRWIPRNQPAFPPATERLQLALSAQSAHRGSRKIKPGTAAPP